MIPELGRSSGGGHGSPLQHSCLENPMDRGPWRATVHGVTESDTTEQLTLSCFFSCRGMVTWLLPETRLGRRGQQDPLLCSPLEAEASCRPHCDRGQALSPGPALQMAAEEALEPTGWGSWKLGSQLERKAELSCRGWGALGTAPHCPPPTWLLVIERRSLAFIFLPDLFDTQYPDLLLQHPCPPELVWGPCGHQPPWWT